MGNPLTKAIRAGASAAIGKMHLGFPAQVVSYDATKQQADLKPILKDSADRELPQLRNVPVMFPRGGKRCYIVFDLEAGDEVFVLFSDRAMDDWLGQSETVKTPIKPTDNRRFDLGDAVCIPGISPWSRALPDPTGDLVVEPGAGEVRLGVGATEYVALATQVKAALDEIQTIFNTHTHTSFGAGPSTGSVGTAILDESTVIAATRVKAE